MTNPVYTKEYINGLLNESEITVKFTKKNGEERVMRCTKVFDKIPEEMRPKEDSKRKISEESDAIAVFDLDISQWRSFNVGNILEVTH